MTRETIQQNAVDALIKNSGGTICVGTGYGKCKILIDFILQELKPGDNVLITVPLGVLIQNWIDEFKKWTSCTVSSTERDVIVKFPDKDGFIHIVIETIQTAYKWRGPYYTLLAVDEVHTTCTTEYSAIFTNLQYKYCIGLTATPDTLRREDKQRLYDLHLPIIYEYSKGEEDGVVNKTEFVIVNHNLDNIFRVKTGGKHKQWMVGERDQYEYLSKQIKNGQVLMAQAGSSDFFSDASEWFWKKNGTKEQSEAGRKYLGSITSRRKFLLSLQSTSEIAKRLAKQIILENETNKVLVFSEQVDQLKKICKFNVYGEQPKELNEELIADFNDGDIRALGSCYQLTLGMNLIGANNAVIESYQGSDVKATQRIGRLHRLQKDLMATIYIVKVLNTQSEKWFDSMMQEYDLSTAKYIDSSTILK